MAGHVKSRESRFVDKHAQLKREVMLKMLDYIKALQRSCNPGSEPPDAAVPVEIPRNVTETEDGFPKTPRAEDLSQSTKTALEQSLRDYLNAQYSESLSGELRWPT
jgi:hypothetical protein